MRKTLTLLAGALTALSIVAVVWLAFVYSGFYNVAASQEHTALIEWSLGTMSERSVSRHAEELPAPLPTDSAELLHGLEHYRAMCEVCHGAPGVDRGEIGEGLNPRPPRLTRAAAGWSDAELFWIVKHGIKATGMPAFGVTHDDASLLQIVAVVRRLTDTSPEQYLDWVLALEASGLAGHHDEGPELPADSTGAIVPHTHPPGTPPHSH